MRRWLWLVGLVVALRVTTARAESPAPDEVPSDDGSTPVDGDIIMGSPQGVLMAKQVPARKLVHVLLGGDAPAWEVLRTQARDAFARMRGAGLVPDDYSLFLQFIGNDRVALASPGEAPLVGNGYTMLDDPAAYVIAASPRAKTLGTFSFTSGDRATCSGDLENLGQTPLNLTVRCRIIGTFKAPYSFTTRTAGTPVVATMAEKTLELKALPPGKTKKYSFGLGKLTYPPGQSEYNYGNQISFSTTFEVDGKEVPHFDKVMFTEGLAWLTLLDGVRPLGFQLELIGKWQRGETILAFTRPSGWSAPYDKTAKADAGKLWKQVKAHLKKHFKKELLSIWLRDKGVTVAKIDGGKLLEGGP